MYGSLPKNEMTIEFKETGVDTGLEYTGDFLVKCVLTIQDKHSVALEKTRLMADTANPTGDLAGIAVTLAEVRARIIEAPKWWAETDRGAKMFDENILLRLYDKCMDCEDEWRKSLKKKAEDSKEEEKTEAQAEGN